MVTEEDKDKLIRALSLLNALHQNSSGNSIEEYNSLTTSHVNQLHAILSSISSVGIDVTEFFIPEEEIKPRVTSISTLGGGGTTYSEEKYIRKSLFLTKLDGIINYLNSLLEEPPRKAGFNPRS